MQPLPVIAFKNNMVNWVSDDDCEVLLIRAEGSLEERTFDSRRPR